MKTSMYFAAGLDGFIARSNGSIDWLGNTDEQLDDYGYKAFYESVGAIVMGGNTFRQIRSSHEW